MLGWFSDAGVAGELQWTRGRERERGVAMEHCEVLPTAGETTHCEGGDLYRTQTAHSLARAITIQPDIYEG